MNLFQNMNEVMKLADRGAFLLHEGTPRKIVDWRAGFGSLPSIMLSLDNDEMVTVRPEEVETFLSKMALV